MLYGRRAMGDWLDEDLSGSDSAGLQTSNTVQMSDQLATPSWASGQSSMPPTITTASTLGVPTGGGFWSDLGKSFAVSGVSDVAAAINRALGATPGSLAAQRAAAAARPSSGPSTALVLGGVAALVVVGALVLRRSH